MVPCWNKWRAKAQALCSQSVLPFSHKTTQTAEPSSVRAFPVQCCCCCVHHCGSVLARSLDVQQRARSFLAKQIAIKPSPWGEKNNLKPRGPSSFTHRHRPVSLSVLSCGGVFRLSVLPAVWEKNTHIRLISPVCCFLCFYHNNTTTMGELFSGMLAFFFFFFPSSSLTVERNKEMGLVTLKEETTSMATKFCEAIVEL